MTEKKAVLGQVQLQKSAAQPARGRESKLQSLGKQSVSTLYMLMRNVKMYDPDNEIFSQPFENLKQSVNTIVAIDGMFQLNAVGTSVYVNSKQLKLDFQSLEHVQFLTTEFKENDVGGFSVESPVKIEDLKTFIWRFSPKNKDGGNPEQSEGESASIQVGKFARIVEQIDKMEENAIETERRVDRKKYAMTVYARAIFYMRRFIEQMKEGGKLPSMAPASRIIRDLVDVAFEQRSHFLGMTTTRSADEYLLYHSVNTALISIVFGSELGMTRAQLHELGMAGLFHEIGIALVNDEILNKESGLTADERTQVDLYPLHTVKALLKSRMMDATMVKQIIASYETKVDYSVPMKDREGKLKLMFPKVEIGIFGRILNIAACYDALTSARPFREPYGPEIAMTLMAGDMRFKFDPWLLKVFMKVMAIQPVRTMDPSARRISLI